VDPSGDGEVAVAGACVSFSEPVAGASDDGDGPGAAVPEPVSGEFVSPVAVVGYFVGKGEGLNEGTEDTPADGESAVGSLVGVCPVGLAVTSFSSFSETSSSSVGAGVGDPGT
jgi:hypothetical protein